MCGWQHRLKNSKRSAPKSLSKIARKALWKNALRAIFACAALQSFEHERDFLFTG